MNATNRGVNRVVLCVVGLLLLAAGVAVTLAALWPELGKLWTAASGTAVEWMTEAHDATRISDATTVSWFVIGVFAVLLVIMVLAVTVIARLGGGRSHSVIREEAGDDPHGAITIGHRFSDEAISHSLSSHDDILSSRIVTRRVRGEDVLQVSVTPRQNASPVDVAHTVTELVDNLAILTGKQIPTLISIHAGIRSKLAGEQSRVNTAH